MKRGLMAAALLVVAFAVQVWAADNGSTEKNVPATGGNPKQGALDIKERRTLILKGLDERIAVLQKDKQCVQKAETDVDLQNCRQQSRGARENLRRDGGPLRDRDRMRPSGSPVPSPAPAPVPATPAQGK